MLISAENKRFAKLLIGISVPVALQQLLMSSVNMLDIFMIGRIGENEITAVSLANQVFFLFTLLNFGVNSGASIFTAQYWGRNDVDSIHKMMGIGFLVGILGALPFVIGGLFFPNFIMNIYSQNPEVVEIGAGYLKIVVLSYVLTALTTTINFALRSIGETKIPMLITLVSLLCNGLFNGLLIFGLLGFPRLGVTGAAIATFISRTVEFLIISFLLYKLKFPIAAGIKKYFSFDIPFFKIFLKTAGFVIINEFVWALGSSFYNVGYKYAGTQAQCAIQIANNIRDMSMVISMGIGSAAAVILGNLIGANQKDTAWKYAVKLLKITFLFGIIVGIILFIIRPYIMLAFNVDKTVYNYTLGILAAVAAFIPFKCLNQLIVVGILRSGGDTTATLFIDTLPVWFIGVPMSFLGTKFLGLPIYFVAPLVYSEEIFKAIFGLFRVKKRKWLKNI